jgi:hypothetical protein
MKLEILNHGWACVDLPSAENSSRFNVRLTLWRKSADQRKGIDMCLFPAGSRSVVLCGIDVRCVWLEAALRRPGKISCC